MPEKIFGSRFSKEGRGQSPGRKGEKGIEHAKQGEGGPTSINEEPMRGKAKDPSEE